jgi:hypothetical protein
MSKTVVVIQSNYIPWRGYFDIIRRADEFIQLDSVQYTKHDWRNRNVVRSETGPRWLTIPVSVSGLGGQSIDQARAVRTDWAEKHIEALVFHYRHAACLDEVGPWLFDRLRAAAALPTLSESNRLLIDAICAWLGITTPIRRCTEILDRGEMRDLSPSARVARLCAAAGATRYLSGPTARDYLDHAPFEAAGIAVDWMDYAGLPPYPQAWPGFEPAVSVVDLLLNTGADAASFLGADRGPETLVELGRIET